MRILHTEWSDGLGGQEKRVLAELTGLAGRGYDMLLVCRQEARIRPEAEKRGIRVITLPLRRSYDVSSILKLRRILREQAVDIVNTHSGVDSWIGAIAAKLAGVPLLVRTRHLNIPLKRNPFNFVHYLPDLYITCGENMRNTLIACGFSEDRLFSIPTGVTDEFFHVQRDPALKAKYGIKRTAQLVVSVGILRSVKGQEITLQAVDMVADKYPDVRFLFAGDGPARERLEQTADALGIRERVLFPGFVHEIAEIYSIADVSVLSSWSEGLPQSILQSMAAGIPVVATAVGGVPEVVIHGETGLLVPAGDHKALAKGILRLLEDGETARSLAENGKRLVRERHSVERMLDRTEELYLRLLRPKPPGGPVRK